MTNTQIIKALDAHSIPYLIVNGHVLADSMEAGTKPMETVVDLTGYTKSALYSWLGY